MITEIVDKKGYPWILFTAENSEEWLKLTTMRDDVFDFDTDDCCGQYSVYQNMDEKARQYMVKLDNHCMDDEIEKMGAE